MLRKAARDEIMDALAGLSSRNPEPWLKIVFQALMESPLEQRRRIWLIMKWGSKDEEDKALWSDFQVLLSVRLAGAVRDMLDEVNQAAVKEMSGPELRALLEENWWRLSG
jgi:hypothetical protein